MTIFFRDSEAIGGSYFKYTMSWIFAAGCCKICLELAPFQGVAAVGGVVPLHGAARYLWQCGALGRWWRLGSAVPKSKSAWLLPNFFLLSGVYAGICFCPRRVLLFYLFGCYRYSNIQKIRIYITNYLLSSSWHDIILYGNVRKFSNCLYKIRENYSEKVSWVISRKRSKGLQRLLRFGSWQNHARCWGAWCVGLSENR